MPVINEILDDSPQGRSCKPPECSHADYDSYYKLLYVVIVYVTGALWISVRSKNAQPGFATDIQYACRVFIFCIPMYVVPLQPALGAAMPEFVRYQWILIPIYTLVLFADGDRNLGCFSRQACAALIGSIGTFVSFTVVSGLLGVVGLPLKIHPSSGWPHVLWVYAWVSLFVFGIASSFKFFQLRDSALLAMADIVAVVANPQSEGRHEPFGLPGGGYVLLIITCASWAYLFHVLPQPWFAGDAADAAVKDAVSAAGSTLTALAEGPLAEIRQQQALALSQRLVADAESRVQDAWWVCFDRGASGARRLHLLRSTIVLRSVLEDLRTLVRLSRVDEPLVGLSCVQEAFCSWEQRDQLPNWDEALAASDATLQDGDAASVLRALVRRSAEASQIEPAPMSFGRSWAVEEFTDWYPAGGIWWTLIWMVCIAVFKTVGHSVGAMVCVSLMVRWNIDSFVSGIFRGLQRLLGVFLGQSVADILHQVFLDRTDNAPLSGLFQTIGFVASCAGLMALGMYALVQPGNTLGLATHLFPMFLGLQTMNTGRMRGNRADGAIALAASADANLGALTVTVVGLFCWSATRPSFGASADAALLGALSTAAECLAGAEELEEVRAAALRARARAADAEREQVLWKEPWQGDLCTGVLCILEERLLPALHGLALVGRGRATSTIHEDLASAGGSSGAAELRDVSRALALALQGAEVPRALPVMGSAPGLRGEIWAAIDEISKLIAAYAQVLPVPVPSPSVCGAASGSRSASVSRLRPVPQQRRVSNRMSAKGRLSVAESA